MVKPSPLPLHVRLLLSNKFRLQFSIRLSRQLEFVMALQSLVCDKMEKYGPSSPSGHDPNTKFHPSCHVSPLIRKTLHNLYMPFYSSRKLTSPLRAAQTYCQGTLKYKYKACRSQGNHTAQVDNIPNR
jgi:hypothetical protein